MEGLKGICLLQQEAERRIERIICGSLGRGTKKTLKGCTFTGHLKTNARMRSWRLNIMRTWLKKQEGILTLLLVA